MNFYLNSVEAVFDEVKSTASGLTASEAEARLAANGKNKLDEGKKISALVRFFRQMADPMIIILIVAAAISGLIAVIENGGFSGISVADFADVIIIMSVVLLNAVLGVIQESKAEKAIEALKEMTAATSKVIRDGKQITIHSSELVVGDIVVLEAGDSVPADCRLIESASIKCEEAALTGESVPVDKHSNVIIAGQNGDVPLGDRANMVYMGSAVVYGRGKAVVVATGMNTEMGKIATALTNVVEEKTPLQVKLAGLSKILTWLVLGICAVILGVGIIRGVISGELVFDSGFVSALKGLLDPFMVAVSLAVAAIPEGLAAVVTIVLSIGVTKMSKRSAVIRKLTAVETLGCTQVICSDKTGTLTQNKMTVVDDMTFNREALSMAMTLCNDAEPDENGVAIGEPTECALVNYATKNGYLKPELISKMPRVGEVPFDSGRKMMTTVHRWENKFIQYTKGAPDELLSRCTFVLTEDGVKPMSDTFKNEILTCNKKMADKALRVLAAAYCEHESEPSVYSSEQLENSLTFIGLCGMIDPVRPEVLDAIKSCRSAGIRPIMITGDHKDTAVAIALELGIIKNASEAITGAEINELSDEAFEKVIDKYSVYARVQPEHKVRIVSAWKKKGKITAMTGDGVNDAPSIKTADIGIGMGITGTDVTKNVADMVLGDDNFATIVYAVEEGRVIYSNIRKAIQFLLSSNMSEVITIFTAQMVGFTILKAPHLLWINLITDCFPALALGMEKGENDIMTQKPRSGKDGIFSGGLGIDMVYQGVIVSVLTLIAFYLGEFFETNVWTWIPAEDTMHGMTMAFLTMSMAEIFHAYNMRSQRGSVFKLKTFNKWLVGSMALALLLTTFVIECPGVNDFFGFAPIGIEEYFTSLGLAVTIIPIVELIKFIQRRIEKRKHKKDE